ncbi:response regulator [Paucibacter sp. APW11]|uniref:Response regulator n=1 Tax=Roseateles aquae TaxID=3077235 RepID=A0ABU3PE21_9BURK|nr:HD domain-containing phosphohydrolase [Paucibacter sp. APW11]MDT9000789.1 response regulator [Paucibacter sp. APW11]
MKIIIIDDNQINLTLLKVICRQLPGTESLEFLDPRAALAWCQSHEPDLVVVDYQMPEMDGVAFIKALRATPGRQETPLLMITANHERELRYEALNAGASDFLTKPVDRMEFLARARNMLALRQGQKALAGRAEWLAQEVEKATQTILERERDTIFRLSRAAEYRDPETGAHVMRMAHYSRLIAANLGAPADFQDLLFQAAPMHDIGKVGTPDHILLKPGRLTPEEMTVMRQHASIGYEILRDSPSPFLQLAATVAHSHHEKFDGSGYPQGLRGLQIPLAGRIVAVADVFDALTSARPYKQAWTMEAARDFLLQHSGGHFDAGCVKAFLQDWAAVLDVRERFEDDPEDIAYRKLHAAPTRPMPLD